MEWIAALQEAAYIMNGWLTWCMPLQRAALHAAAPARLLRRIIMKPYSWQIFEQRSARTPHGRTCTLKHGRCHVAAKAVDFPAWQFKAQVKGGGEGGGPLLASSPSPRQSHTPSIINGQRGVALVSVRRPNCCSESHLRRVKSPKKKSL